jgi:lysophospholipase L1-like esterase
MGDSFVEGDIVTCDLRDELQRRFGGRGVGFIPADIPFATVRKSIKRSSSKWNTYSVMKTKEAPDAIRERLFISGYLAEGGAGATTRWQATNVYPTLDSCTQARILLISRDTSRVEVILGDTLRNEFMIAGDERVREIFVEGPVDDIRLRVVEGNVMCYGASMEGKGGITVDNFSVRSNNGHAIFGTSATVNRQIDEMLGYDLVVLQYGLNIMQKGQRGYAKYRDQVRDMIAYAERCFPNAAIMVVGVSDRWVKNAETGEYEPIGSVDALTSYQRAAADSCNVVFWNTSRVMNNLGGMPAFVSNGWAAKDYTHINYAGGKRIADAITEAIRQRVYNHLVEREEAARLEAERQAELQRQRELESKELLESKISAVAPIIDSLGWNSETNNTNSEE